MVTKLLFLDVSKAFDKVWHRGLIYKLNRLGISGELLEFFRDYLEDRQQRVALKGALSSWITIKAGVPQGSIMGPILFLIYTNDLPTEIQSIIKMFADDTILGATGNTSEECSNILQPNIDKLAAWARKWKIKLNPSKTKCLTISRKKNMYSCMGKEAYLSGPKSEIQIAMARMRIGGHGLPIETGRWGNIQIRNRVCQDCDTNEIGNEWHIFRCPATQKWRPKNRNWGTSKKQIIKKMKTPNATMKTFVKNALSTYT